MNRLDGTILFGRWALCAAAGALFAGAAVAGDASVPAQPGRTPNDARCGALGEGFFAAPGSDACIRISGYVAAGAEFAGGLRPGWRGAAPFDSGSAMRTGVSADARFDTPMGPGRIFVDIGRDNFSP
jgi:hypothetical protein